MCGICGALDTKGRAVDPSIIESMTDALSHRGPDDRGVHVAGGLGLGHTRLSIIDLSSAGHQPMTNDGAAERGPTGGRLWLKIGSAPV